MKNMIPAAYNGHDIQFTEDGWFNATEVAASFGKETYEWLRLPETERYIAALCKKYEAGKSRFVKTRKGGAGGGGSTWLHPKLAVRFAQWLDMDFAIWCDEQVDAILRGNHPHHDWKRLRHEATSSFKVMNAVLQMQRQIQGKPVAPYHFSNEARLINWALTGEFKGVDRETLATGELDMLAKLEERNTVLMGCGLSYEERKKALERFATDWRAIHSAFLESAA